MDVASIGLKIRAAWGSRGSSRSLMDNKDMLRAWISHRHDTEVKEKREII